MKYKRMLVLIFLILMMVNLRSPQNAKAKPIWTDYTAIETVTEVIYPGDSHNLSNGGVLLRGKNVQAVEAADDPRVSGISTLIMNANLDPSLTGPIWGNIIIEIPESEDCQGGGVWEGRWEGELSYSQSYVSWYGVMHGVSGCVEGVVVRFESDICIPDQPCSYHGTILESTGREHFSRQSHPNRLPGVRSKVELIVFGMDE